MHSLINQAFQMGANAVVDLNMATESYQFTEPKKLLVFPAVKWTAPKVIYAGTERINNLETLSVRISCATHRSIRLWPWAC